MREQAHDEQTKKHNDKGHWLQANWRSTVAILAVVVTMISASTANAQLTPAQPVPARDSQGEVGIFPVAVALAGVTCAVAVTAGAYVFGLWRGKRKCDREADEKERQAQGGVLGPLRASEANLD